MYHTSHHLKTIILTTLISFGLSFSLTVWANDSQNSSKLAEVSLQTFKQTLTGFGQLKSANLFTLTALNNGRVLKLTAQPGQLIHKGDILFYLKTLVSSKILKQQKSDLLIAEIALDYAQKEYQSTQNLYQKRGTYLNQLLKTKMILLQAKAKVAQLKRDIAFSTTSEPYLSPITGQVSQIIQPNGTAVSQGKSIIKLMPCTTLRGTLAIFDDFNQLKVGQTLQITLNHKEIKTSLKSIAPQLNAAGAKQVIFSLPNLQCQFKAHTFIQGQVLTQTRSALAIPSKALVIQKGQPFVILSTKQGFLLKKVKIGQKRPGLVEILAGLKQGDKVLVDQPYEWLHKDIAKQMTILD